MNPIRNSLNSEMAGAAEQAVQAAAQALGRTRQLASQAVEESGEQLRNRAYAVSDATTAAQRQLGHYARATRRYVSKQPVKSALIAAALGAAVAGLVLAMRRNSRQN
jgi:ElaB/YqjD/DUF883 family membrane-anchored ribosome-binding protein